MFLCTDADSADGVEGVDPQRVGAGAADQALDRRERVAGDGAGLHRGARICSAGHGGQILLSNVTRELSAAGGVVMLTC